MSVQSYAATVNELACAYHLNKRQWVGTTYKDFADAAQRLPVEHVQLQMRRSEHMANAVVQYLATQPDTPEIQAIHWVAKSGQLSRIVERATYNHPADLVVGLSNGSYWGISAKSSQSFQVPMRNPGLGSIESAIGIAIQPILDKIVMKTVTDFQCPITADARKTFLRSNPTIQETTRKWGAHVLRHVRDVVWQRIQTWSHQQYESFIDTVLIQRDIYPQYVHVKGFGDSTTTFGAVVTNPRDIVLNDLHAKPAGNTTIEFYAGVDKIAALRAKFESEPLASTLKWSVE